MNKYKQYCTICHYTVYSTEGYVVNKRDVRHYDCTMALSDLNIRRTLNPRISNLIGNASKRKLVKMLDESVRAKALTAPAGRDELVDWRAQGNG